MAGGTNRLHHFEDTLAHPRLANLVVGPHQLKRLALDQRILLLLEWRRGLAEALPPAARHWPAGEGIRGHLVEEIGYRHIEHLGELEETARANAVGAALVLLNLLEGQADRCSEFLLAHAKKSAP